MSVSLSAVFDGDEFANLPSPFSINRDPSHSNPPADKVLQDKVNALMWKLAEQRKA